PDTTAAYSFCFSYPSSEPYSNSLSEPKLVRDYFGLLGSANANQSGSPFITVHKCQKKKKEKKSVHTRVSTFQRETCELNG
ncbi:unnamed protein product, partial [Callosobruchus maculatus]